jgi:Zn-dependent protease with chaperone function
MDFFAHQEVARKRTKLLLFYYAIAVGLLIVATYAATMFAFGARHRIKHGPPRVQPAILDLSRWWNFHVFAASSICTLTIIGLGTLWRVIELRRGGSAVAEMLGGRPVDLSPTDEGERRLRNVIEEMAIASGTPVPEIYLLDGESAINAFAAGHSADDMAIGVTRGCVDHLSRDELQGVIGHEFSHILNGDTRLNIRLMGVLHGILCLYIIGRVLLEMRSRSSKDKNPLPLFGLLLMLIGAAGLLCSRLIQAAVSRQREFLADASAVEFTRNPNGIAGALKKIGGLSEGSQLEASQAQSASHFFFANGLAESWFGLMATHPPLDERVRRIDPSFKGEFPRVSQIESLDEDAEAHLTRAFASATAAEPPPRHRRVRAESIARSAGQSVPIRYASGVIEALPHELRLAARDAWSATALLCATVLAHDPDLRNSQHNMIAQALGAPLATQAAQFADLLGQCDRRARLPLVSLSLPALRKSSLEQWQRLSALLDQLVCCDNQIDLFEFVLKKIVARNMDAHFAPRSSAVVQFYSFNAVANDCALLISALANVGNAEASGIETAFKHGLAQLPLNVDIAPVPRSECGVQQIDTALTRLSQAVPHIKKVVLNACAETVACDGTVTADEAELLRAVADALGCPVPPSIEGV